jgi:serine protease AprX
VGAADDRGTAAITDDLIPSFSAYGTTSDGFAKPDLVAPGRNIISLLASDDSNLAVNHPAHKVSGNYSADYFRMSGTSMASAVVAGAVALLLQDEPNLTPDQVKHRLKATANKSWSAYSAQKAGAGYLDIQAAVTGTTTQSANTGIAASQLLWTGSQPVVWGSVSWNSVSWNSVSWNSVSWNSVSWNSVSWNSMNRNSVQWDD